MTRINGGMFGPQVSPNAFTAPGIWSLGNQQQEISNNTWPRGFITSGLGLHLNALSSASYPGSGTTWFDLSGNGLNATGSVAITGNALQNGQAYSTASTSLLNTDTHSIFFSIQLNSTSGNWDKILSFNAGGSDRSPGIWRYPNNRVIHWRYDPGNTGLDPYLNGINSGTEFSTNTWYYIGVTKNGASATAYVNGVSIGSATVANPKTAGNAAIVLYENFSGSSRMRHVHVYNRALTADEVAYNYQSVAPQLT